ncbi:MFS transporter [Virgibacillus halodenitrificans]|uniref:MFS transporter n=1 Tax=Virgibacillus halodenitrificans TaxID=1482 RepID=UPI001FB306CD|nr:MFS transporter [Virgibacillus halodenitrificans]MCJ0930501.1 MFS transporter [Virgibacillus halodenitrificans]
MEHAQAVEREKNTSLLKSMSFVILWIATVISSLSLSMFMFIQTWYVVDELKMEASLGIVMICLTVARMLSMIIGGVLADKSKQTRIMFISDSSRAILLLGLAIAFLFIMEVPIWVLAINAAFFGVFGGLFEPSRDSILPKIVQTEQLTRANSLIQGAIQVALFSGPLLAGLLISMVSYHILLIFISLLLGIAGLGVLFIRINQGSSQEKIQNDGMSFIKQLKEGFVYTWEKPLLRALFTITVITNLFISGPLMMGLPIFVESVLKGDSLDFSFVQGGFTFGMIAGSIIIGIININRNRGAYALYLIALQGVGMLLFSQVKVIEIAIPIIILIGMLNPAINIPLISMVQTYTDKNKVGRVMSLIRTGSLGLIPLSYAITSFFLGIGIKINVIMAWSSIPLLVSVTILFIGFPIMRKAE